MTGITPETGNPLDIPALLAALTPAEKADLVGGSDFWHTWSVERLGIPRVRLSDGPHGLRTQPGPGDHLGLGTSMPATCFPPAAGLASSWDVTLVARVGEALGRECRAAEVAVLLGPGVNIKRSPLCGRNFEYFSEDPLLAGRLGAAFVEGVQSTGVGTALKHFAANNQETDRMTISAEVDERTLREIYLPAFEHVVTTARPWSVMCSYNRLNGVYASEHRWLLTEVLRDDWGYDGLVMSDWGAVNLRERAVHAGLDLEMPGSGGVGARRVLAALGDGTLSEQDLDRAVTHVLELVDRALPALAPGQTFDADAHHALAREAAADSIVLLKNDGSILPLDPAVGGSVAVIGELARTVRFQGAGSSQVVPTRLDDALSALTSALVGRREVTFAPGYVIESRAIDADLAAQAVEHARAAAVVVLFLGMPASYESEGYDREHMDLPPQQIDLLEAVAAVNENVVVVLSNGSVVTLEPWQSQAKAVLEGWLLGQAGGGAIADVLLGVTNPSGKLAETAPVQFEDNPTVGNFPGENGVVRYGERLLIGYRWYDAHQLDVAYPFGHGMSYTTFAYSDLRAVVVEDGPGTRVDVEFTVTNTGTRTGRETAQLYVADPESSVYRPEQELRAFAKVSLEPGASTRVRLALSARAFAFWDTASGRWAVEGGAFEIRVGASSRDVRLSAVVELRGTRATAPLTADSPVGSWLSHPVVGADLERALGAAGPEGFADALADPASGQMFRAIPMVRLSRFPGSPIHEDELDTWMARAAGLPLR
ncbi:beta-glucosidase [Cellulomonas hominis]